MEKAVDAARQGSLAYFESLEADEFARLCNRKDEDGRYLLHTAAVGGNLQLVQLIMNAGSSEYVSCVDDEGWSPLMSAVSCGHQSVSEYLIELGADVKVANSGGQTALHYAASKGKVGLVKLLLEHKAFVDHKDSTGSTPLHRAASAGKSESVKMLLELGRAKIDSLDKLGGTALFNASSSVEANVAILLAMHGADIHAANKDEQTPLSVANEALAAALKKAAQSAMDVDGAED